MQTADLKVRLFYLRGLERGYNLGFTHHPTYTGANRFSQTDIVAVRREIAKIEAELTPTFTLEQILAEL